MTKMKTGWSTVAPAAGGNLLVLWIVALILVVGPWLGANFWVDELIPAASLDKFNAWYWPVVAIYLLVCYAWHPGFIGSGKMGIMGMRFDDPTTYEDDVNRQIEGILIVMIPGKTVGYAIYSTWKLFF